MPKIAIDVMGGDYAPDEIIKGCIRASKETKCVLVLVGKESVIKEKLKDYTYDPNKIEIVNAEDVITMEDSPVTAIRTKKDSSMVVGFKMLKENEGDVFISARKFRGITYSEQHYL